MKLIKGFSGGSVVKTLLANALDSIPVNPQKDPQEKQMATHSSNLAWRIPWTEEPGGYSPRGCKELDTTERLKSKQQPN